MERRIVWALTVLFAAGVAWMLWPFMDAIVLGAFLAYVLYYLEETMRPYIDSRRLRSTIILSLLAALVMALVYGVTSSITLITSNIDSFLTSFSDSISFIIEVFDLPDNVGVATERLIQGLNDRISAALLSQLGGIPSLLINLFIFGLTTLYLYRRGTEIRAMVYTVIERLDGYRGEVALTFARNTEDLFRDIYIEKTVIGFTMLLLAGAGYYILGIEFWWAWAILTAVFGFLPLVGAPLIYVPVGLLYMAIGSFWIGVLIIIYGVVVVNAVTEAVLVPRLGGPDRTEDSVLLLLGFLAGPIVLGPKGIILGPAVLVLTRKFLVEFYRLDDR